MSDTKRSIKLSGAFHTPLADGLPYSTVGYIVLPMAGDQVARLFETEEQAETYAGKLVEQGHEVFNELWIGKCVRLTL
jgi:hypothetical protein